MAKNGELFGKTYDQQLDIVGADITKVDIAPNRRVAGEIVLEPMGNGVRVTARDGSHKVLWGFVASKGMLDQVHCLVAIYDPLVQLIVEELSKHHLPAPGPGDPVAEAKHSIASLEQLVHWLKASLQVEQQTKAALARATTIARISSEACRQITLDAEVLRGMKSKADPNRNNGD